MARISLNKSTLSEQLRQLKACQNFLPALDLKRRQLLSEQQKARLELDEVQRRQEALNPTIQQQLPMLGYEQVDLVGLVKLTDVELIEENVMGIHLPRVGRLNVHIAEYPFLAKPHWVDRVVQALKQAIEIRIQRQVVERRLELLEHSAKVVSQRVNLFERVLIPRIRANIQRIRVFLSDSDRASTVRAKIAKGGKEAS